MTNPNNPHEVRAALEAAFVNNIERNFGHFEKFDHSMDRIFKNARLASNEQLLRGANASQQELMRWASEPGEFNPFRYH